MTNLEYLKEWTNNYNGDISSQYDLMEYCPKSMFESSIYDEYNEQAMPYDLLEYIFNVFFRHIDWLNQEVDKAKLLREDNYLIEFMREYIKEYDNRKQQEVVNNLYEYFDYKYSKHKLNKIFSKSNSKGLTFKPLLFIIRV